MTTAEMEDEDGETTSKLSELLKKNRIKPDRLQEIVAGGISSFQITLNDVENFLWKDIDDEDIELLLDLSGGSSESYGEDWIDMELWMRREEGHQTVRWTARWTRWAARSMPWRRRQRDAADRKGHRVSVQRA